MALESVDAARSFGDSDFRLGVSLCLLADTQLQNQKVKDAEASYKQSIRVLSRAEKAAADAGAPLPGKSTQPNALYSLVAEDLGISYFKLGDFYLKLEKPEKASKCFGSAAEKFELLLAQEKKLGLATDLLLQKYFVKALLSLAGSLKAIDRRSEAEVSFRKALAVAAENNYDEGERRQIRDDFLKLLQEEGRQNDTEAQQLMADILYSQYSADGKLAFSEGDYTSAEIAYRKAFAEAAKSVYSEQRILRSLLDLINVFAFESKPLEVVRCSQLADQFMISHRQANREIYDQIQNTLANYYYISGNYPLAEAACLKQLQFRPAHYGFASKEHCMSCAQMALVEMKMGKLKESEYYARMAYNIINSKPLDRRYFAAIGETAKVTLVLQRFKETETLNKRLIAIKRQSHEEADVSVVSLQANLLLVYASFGKHKEAKEMLDRVISVMKSAKAEQRAVCFPYLAAMLTMCLNASWIDLANSLAELCRPILQKDLNGEFPGEIVKNSWQQAMTRMAATGH